MPPIILEGLEAAIRRIPPTHPAFPHLQSRLTAVKAGFGGEQELDRVLKDYHFPDTTLILNDMSLSSSSLFQLDTLLLTKEFALICEVKNIAGDLLVKENPPQLVRTASDGTLTGFLSPIAQTRNSCLLLEDWLRARHIDLPVYGCVVMAYAKQRITLPATEIPTLFPRLVPQHVRRLVTGDERLTALEVSNLAHQLLDSQKPFAPRPVCELYDVPLSALKPGVECPACERLGMWKRGKSWYCPSCQARSSDAHVQAIRDWFLLTGKPLSNASCRNFLALQSPRSTLRLLSEMGLTQTGKNRGRTYTLSLGKELSKHT